MSTKPGKRLSSKTVKPWPKTLSPQILGPTPPLPITFKHGPLYLSAEKSFVWTARVRIRGSPLSSLLHSCTIVKMPVSRVDLLHIKCMKYQIYFQHSSFVNLLGGLIPYHIDLMLLTPSLILLSLKWTYMYLKYDIESLQRRWHCRRIWTKYWLDSRIWVPYWKKAKRIHNCR